MSIPQNYQWITKLDPLPRTIVEALKLFGVHEVLGSGSNKTILEWRDELNQNGVKIDGYSDDDIPWCGLFAAIVTFRAGKKPVGEPLWARNWANFGKETPDAGLGDILVFVRDGGGHVGFYVAEDEDCYHVLGGNQSDQVCITRVRKGRCVARRRPPYTNMPSTVRRYNVSSEGNVSRNEA
jgi:uncharacterized protein (TIGR02594 family)